MGHATTAIYVLLVCAARVAFRSECAGGAVDAARPHERKALLPVNQFTRNTPNETSMSDADKEKFLGHGKDKIKVLFVCNNRAMSKCQSEVARNIFNDVAFTHGLLYRWQGDAAGQALYRQFSVKDFFRYKYIFTMDLRTQKAVSQMQPRRSRSRVSLLWVYDPVRKKTIADPQLRYRMHTTGDLHEQCRRSIEEFFKPYLAEITSDRADTEAP